MASLDKFNDRRLREEALKAFVKALHTDRMVAVTGAMSTRALGYPSWNEFIEAYAIVAETLATTVLKERSDHPGFEEHPRALETPIARLLRDIKKRAGELRELAARPASGTDGVDPRVPLWVLHESFRAVDARMKQARDGLVIKHKYQTPTLRRFEDGVAAIFKSRTLDGFPAEAPIRALIESLGIKRVATLNYDLELERAFMLRADEREILTKALRLRRGRRGERNVAQQSRAERFAAKAFEKAPNLQSSVEFFIGEAESSKPIVKLHRHRLSRTMGDGVHVESDIVDRERPDRLFEFAIGSAETDRHILHLHGRCDAPSSMVANIRQYDRLYRLDDLYRDPFDHSLRVLVGGNPILFVGVGMSEAEINNTLQYFVSNVPVRRPAPTFVIWNTNGLRGKKKKQFMRERRLDFRSRLGVHLLFDQDIAEVHDEWAKSFPKGIAREDAEKGKLQALSGMLLSLPRLVERVDRRIRRSDEKWRSISARLKTKSGSEEPLGPVRILGAKGLALCAADKDIDFLALAKPDTAATCRNVVFASAPNGYGRGELGERLIQMERREIVIGRAKIPATSGNDRLLINAGFSYDSDAVLNGIALFLWERKREPMEGWPCRERYFAEGKLLDTRPHVLVVINGADRYFGFDGTPLSAELDHMLRCALRDGSVQFLLLGTDRLRPYCEALGLELQFLVPLVRIDRVAASLEGSAKLPADETGAARPDQAVLTVSPASGKAGTNVPSTEIAGAAFRQKLQSRYFEWVAQQFEIRALACSKAWGADRKLKGHRRSVKKEQTRISPAAKAVIERALQIDRASLNRAFYEAYLSPVLLQALNVNCAAAFEVLRTLCFIGAPVEAAVLLHAPKVYAILAENPKGVGAGTDMRAPLEVRQKLASVVKDLKYLGFLIELDPHQPGLEAAAISASDEGVDSSEGTAGTDILWARFGLHRSLATFLRDRHGAPINDAKLATSFNMSLFMSDPSDNYTPEPDFHDELGDLVDSLIGGWHDKARIWQEGKSDGKDGGRAPGGKARKPRAEFTDAQLAPFEDQLSQLYIHPGDRAYAISTLGARSSRQAAACLRAALSLVRGYYSTATLLKLDRDHRLASAERDGALTEHAQRLDRLITAFGDTAMARQIVRGLSKGRPADEVLREMGAEPFYADDLVWLHNERGVVALTQGHMFDAREAFSAADEVNRVEVEKDYHGHNWRRIAINMAATLIERGMLKSAERLLDQVDGTVNAAPWKPQPRPKMGPRRRDDHGTRPQRVDAVRALFKLSGEGPRVRGNTEFTREEMLVVAMTTSYRGLIAQMRSRYHEAKEYYEDGTRILRRLGEQRALAHFQRHYASLESHIGDRDHAVRLINYALNAAQSARQIDILHRARVVRAGLWRHISTDAAVLRQGLQDIKDALRYSALSDCYRVRIEASLSLARHMRKSGDYDTALRYATDALTIASRYGHSLQKTMLRIEIGQILTARGDPQSGEALLRTAVALGTSKGYHQALEHVRRARAARDANPPMPNRTDISISP